MKDRYSFIILVVISVFLSGVAVGVSIWQIKENNHKFCQVVQAVTATPVPKPEDPKSNPSREQNYEGYMKFVDLGRSLGC